MKAKWLAPVLALLVSCGSASSGYLYAGEPDPRKVEYVLGPSDVVSVSVWGVADVSGNARVRPDGAITIPLVGDVRAAGRTPSELRNEVQQRLATYIKDESAVVSIELAEIHSYRVLVLGRVGGPGVIEADHYLTVNEAIAKAGGPTPFAKIKRVVLIRQRQDGTVVTIPIRYDLVASGLSPEQNLILLGGDQIYVP